MARKARKNKQEGKGKKKKNEEKEDGKEESRKSKAHPYTLRPLTPDRPPPAAFTGNSDASIAAICEHHRLKAGCTKNSTDPAHFRNITYVIQPVIR